MLCAPALCPLGPPGQPQTQTTGSAVITDSSQQFLVLASLYLVIVLCHQGSVTFALFHVSMPFTEQLCLACRLCA